MTLREKLEMQRNMAANEGLFDVADIDTLLAALDLAEWLRSAPDIKQMSEAVLWTVTPHKPQPKPDAKIIGRAVDFLATLHALRAKLAEKEST